MVEEGDDPAHDNTLVIVWAMERTRQRSGLSIESLGLLLIFEEQLYHLFFEDRGAVVDIDGPGVRIEEGDIF
jgi:hypothetical protein